jgi:hypothetical protein
MRRAVAVALLAALDASAAAGGDVASHQKATRSPRVDPEVPGSRSPTTTVLAVLAEVVAHEQTVQPKGAVGGELGASNADTDRRAGERRVDGIASAADVPGLNVHDHAPAQRLPDQLEPLTASADTSTRVLIYHFGTATACSGRSSGRLGSVSRFLHTSSGYGPTSRAWPESNDGADRWAAIALVATPGLSRWIFRLCRPVHLGSRHGFQPQATR